MPSERRNPGNNIATEHFTGVSRPKGWSFARFQIENLYGLYYVPPTIEYKLGHEQTGEIRQINYGHLLVN
jgi:hypothetical protein